MVIEPQVTGPQELKCPFQRSQNDLISKVIERITAPITRVLAEPARLSDAAAALLQVFAVDQNEMAATEIEFSYYQSCGGCGAAAARCAHSEAKFCAA
jgi:hypothetical protein